MIPGVGRSSFGGHCNPLFPLLVIYISQWDIDKYYINESLKSIYTGAFLASMPSKQSL